MCLASFSWISCSSIFSSSFMALFSMTFMPLWEGTKQSEDVRDQRLTDGLPSPWGQGRAGKSLIHPPKVKGFPDMKEGQLGLLGCECTVWQNYADSQLFDTRLCSTEALLVPPAQRGANTAPATCSLQPERGAQTPECTLLIRTHLSLSSAAFSASSSLVRAVARRSWARSNSSSTSWIRLLREATSPSACGEKRSTSGGRSSTHNVENIQANTYTSAQRT